MDEKGYAIYQGVLPESFFQRLEPVLRRFHSLWCKRNRAFYEHKAINSAYLTDEAYLNTADRLCLFESIVAPDLLNIVEQFIAEPAFLNTQLFFDPYNAEQANYWHRDVQYGHSDEQQKQMLNASGFMPHFRIPIVDEIGLELVPGSHNRWDSELEYNTRMGLEGASSSDALPNGHPIALRRGDILVFCAKMLHRGLYGNKRFAFDVLYANQNSDYLTNSSQACLPCQNMPETVRNHPVFARSLAAVQ